MNDELTLDVAFGDGTVVKIDVSGWNHPKQVIGALGKVGEPSYLATIYEALTGDDE